MKRIKYWVLLILILILISIVIGILIKRDVHSFNQDNLTKDTKTQDTIRDTIIQKAIEGNNAIKSSNINENANELNFRFFDEITGYAVVPEYVEIIQRENGKSNKSISNRQISKNGSVLKRVANGVYDITVNAEGYKPMKTFFNLNDQTVNINFNLVPINPPNELSVSYIQSLHQTDAMVIVGSIVDDFTGKPLKKVEVYTADNIEKTYSNERGFFQLTIPLAEDDQKVELRGTIYFKLNNYITEVRGNFDMWPKGDYIFKIRMKKGSGTNREKVIQNREVSRIILNQENKNQK